MDGHEASGSRSAPPNPNIPTIDLPKDTGESPQSGSAGQQRKGKKTVFFTHGADTVDTQDRRTSWTQPNDTTPPVPPALHLASSSHDRHPSIQEEADRSHLPQLSPEITRELRDAIVANSPQPPARPALRRGDSAQYQDENDLHDSGARTPQQVGALQAYQRGKALERRQKASSATGSRSHSPSREVRGSEEGESGIRLQTLDGAVDTDSDEDDHLMLKKKDHHRYQREAEKLVRTHTVKDEPSYYTTPPPEYRSGIATPASEQGEYEDDVPRPEKMRGGVLGMLLSLYNQHEAQGRRSPTHSHKKGASMSSAMSTPGHSPHSSGTSTPVTPANNTGKKHWYSSGKKSASTTSLSKLIESSAVSASPVFSGLGPQVAQRIKERQAEEKANARKRSTASVFCRPPRQAEAFRITVHIAETIARQQYLEKLCRALMEFGAPTHRLEEYMKMSARVLEIEAQFLYIPGSMIISFDDSQTHTASVRLVRCAQGLDLGKLRDVHELYKEVVHDKLGVEEATRRLTEIRKRPRKYKTWLLILLYGLASASVGPFAFGARLIDLPMCFLLGAIVGILQLVIAPRSELYSNVFEVSAAILTSFLARALGSINGGKTFCFSAMAQSAIALILPGYIVLCASLELQSRSIVAGSVRMVYAIIYSLFLGFGIMIGTVIYGRIDANATSATTCTNSIEAPYTFIAVPIFTLCLIVINQGKWKQMPIMLSIAFAGYLTNHYTSIHFGSNSQIASTVGAFAIGVMANLYSRIGRRCELWCLDLWDKFLRKPLFRFTGRVLDRLPGAGARRLAKLEDGRMSAETQRRRKGPHRGGYGLAAAAMLPAIFVQVPSGLAVSGSLISGLTSANQINSKTNSTSSDPVSAAASGLDSMAFGVSISVVQIAIGITLGLFLAAIVIYPSGKRRSGLFSF